MQRPLWKWASALPEQTVAKQKGVPEFDTPLMQKYFCLNTYSTKYYSIVTLSLLAAEASGPNTLSLLAATP